MADQLNIVTDQNISDYIDKLHIRTFGKLFPHVKEQFPNVSKEDVRRVVNKRLKDPFYYAKKNKPLQNKIFSDHPYSYLMDLLENQAEFSPRYFYVFINVNTRYGYAYPIENKNKDTIIETLNLLLAETTISSLTGDNEGSFSSKAVVSFLTDKKISLRIVAENQHGAISLIDRFIRTLRDMNIPTQKTIRQSHHDKYVNFTNKRMQKLMKVYNNTIHDSIGMTPKEMQDDLKKEERYIIDNLVKRQEQVSMKQYPIKENEFVRYLLEKIVMKKRRYKVSRECYKISGVEGQLYIITAADGSTKLIPRWRLIPLGMEKPDNIKLASTIPGVSRGVLNKVIGYGRDRKHYRVEFKLPDDTIVEDVIPIKNLRTKYPQLVGKLEKEFLDTQNQ